MTTVTSALSARAVRLGAPRKVTPRLPSPTPTAPGTNRLTVPPPPINGFVSTRLSLTRRTHETNVSLSPLTIDTRPRRPSRSPSRLASPPARRRSETRIPRENPPSTSAPADSRQRRWAASRSASRRRCPRSPTTAAAAAGRSASSRSSRWRERRSSPARDPAEAEVEEATTTRPNPNRVDRFPKLCEKSHDRQRRQAEGEETSKAQGTVTGRIDGCARDSSRRFPECVNHPIEVNPSSSCV